MQNTEPSGLYCGDESDGDALRICQQIFDSLYQYKVGRTRHRARPRRRAAHPSTDLKTWTCKLRQGVKFAVSGTLDANDVVDSYAAQWDAKNPLHVGNAGTFDYFPALFGGLPEPATAGAVDQALNRANQAGVSHRTAPAFHIRIPLRDPEARS